MNIAKRTVTLNSQGHRLEFDFNEGLFRLAYYYPELDTSGKQIGEHRSAVRNKKLISALDIVFGETDADFDPLTVERYMRSQTWGRELPK